MSYSRFDLEEAMLSMYYIIKDLPLTLDDEERKAAIELHAIRCDKLFEIFEDMVQTEKII